MSDAKTPCEGTAPAAQGTPQEAVAASVERSESPLPVAESPAAQGTPDQAIAPSDVRSESTPSSVPESPAAQPPALPAPPEQPAEEKAAAAASDELPSGKAVTARYSALRSMGLFQHDLEEPLRPGTKVVVRSERGVELADVLANVTDMEGPGAITRQQLKDFLRSAGPEYPFYRSGRLLRLANAQDLIDQRHLNNSAREEALYCRKEIREMKLDMKLVTVEHLLGGERIIFYFAAENRVDFRELVRRLASQFRTRIEMRQVGARDEARLVGDFERCGRPCCCLSFLRDLKPISMRMAKMQKATLDPSKISGRCGRLMCCLRYEDAGYEALRAKLPRKNSIVRTAAGVVGKVIDMQILTQLVRLLLPDNSQMVVSNEEITARDVPLPTPGTSPAGAGPAPAPAPWRSSAASSKAPQGQDERQETPEALPAEGEQANEPEESTVPQGADEVASSAAAPAASQASQSDPGHRRRRHRRGRRHGGGQPAPAGGQTQPPLQAQRQPQGQGQAGGGEGGGGRKRRHRRRRR